MRAGFRLCGPLSPALSPRTGRGRQERICSGFGGLLSFAAMPIGMIEQIGRNTNNAMAMLGDFSVFSGRTLRWMSSWWLHWKKGEGRCVLRGWRYDYGNWEGGGVGIIVPEVVLVSQCYWYANYFSRKTIGWVSQLSRT